MKYIRIIRVLSILLWLIPWFFAALSLAIPVAAGTAGLVAAGYGYKRRLIPKSGCKYVYELKRAGDDLSRWDFAVKRDGLLLVPFGTIQTDRGFTTTRGYKSKHYAIYRAYLKRREDVLFDQRYGQPMIVKPMAGAGTLKRPIHRELEMHNVLEQELLLDEGHSNQVIDDLIKEFGE